MDILEQVCAIHGVLICGAAHGTLGNRPPNHVQLYMAHGFITQIWSGHDMALQELEFPSADSNESLPHAESKQVHTHIVFFETIMCMLRSWCYIPYIC